MIDFKKLKFALAIASSITLLIIGIIVVLYYVATEFTAIQQTIFAIIILTIGLTVDLFKSL